MHAGEVVTLACLDITSARLARPSSDAFMQPLAFALPANGSATLKLVSVSISVDCATLAAYQQWVCAAENVYGQLSMGPNELSATSWRFGSVEISGARLQCNGAGAQAAVPPCGLYNVRSGDEFSSMLGTAGAAWEGASLPRKLVVWSSMQVAAPAVQMQITRNVSILSTGGPETTFALDMSYLDAAFYIQPGERTAQEARRR